jgi:hypothetical protein
VIPPTPDSPRIVRERNIYSLNHNRGVIMVSNKIKAETKLCVSKDTSILVGAMDREFTVKPKIYRKKVCRNLKMC